MSNITVPIIVQRRVPQWVKIASLVVGAIALVVFGFVLGIYASMQQPPAGPSDKVSLTLPPSQSRPVVEVALAEPKPTQDWAYNDINKEVKCLADNMYFEGRNQTVKGQIGIGLATINRVKDKHFKNNVCDVVWFQAKDRRSGKMTAHFSWTLDGKSDRIANKKAYGKLYKLAEAMLSEGSLDNFVDFTDGATHYHADYVTPYWADDLNKIAQIGDHIYYKN